MPMKTRAFPSPRELVDFVNDAEEVTVAAIATGGSGYTALDVLTVVGGEYLAPARIRVDTVGGSNAVTAVTVIDKGEYTSAPANPVAVSGGTGNGATFNLTLAALLAKADVGEIKTRSRQWFLNYWV
jgi:hypothetical protein